MKLVDKSNFTGKDRKKTLTLVRKLNALAEESKSWSRGLSFKVWREKS